MANPKVVNEWFKKAKQDFRKAEYFYESRNADFYDGAIYFCQQTIEKLFKAYLVFMGIRVQKTHDLSALGEAVLEHIDDPPGLDFNFDQLEAITKYATAQRYPDAQIDLPPITDRDIQSALEMAKHLIAELSQRIHLDL